MRPRMIAIGDIHGCSLALESLLDAIQPRLDDTIITLGDYVNRGPDSRGVLDRLIELERRCALIPILGNHDQTFLAALAGEPRALSDLLDMGGGPTLTSYGGADLPKEPTWSASHTRSPRFPRAVSRLLRDRYAHLRARACAPG